MKFLKSGLLAPAAATLLCGCASMDMFSQARSDTAKALGVSPHDLTIVSQRYESSGSGYMLTDYTVATRDGLTYICILDSAETAASAAHYRPVCKKRD